MDAAIWGGIGVAIAAGGKWLHGQLARRNARTPDLHAAGVADHSDCVSRADFEAWRIERERDRGEQRAAIVAAVNECRDATRVDVAALREIVVRVEVGQAEHVGGANARAEAADRRLDAFERRLDGLVSGTRERADPGGSRA